MHSMVKAFPKMLESFQLPKETQDMCVRLREKELGGICVIGMGGSSIAGQYVQALLRESAPVPIINVHDSTLPAFIDNSWITIAVSYSGNTEETLLAHEEAKKRGCQTFAIASGGKLLSDNKVKSLITLPPDFQPRAAFPLVFSAVLHVVELLLGRELTDLSIVSEAVVEKEEQWESSPIAPKEMAKDFLERIPVFIGSGHLNPVAYRAKCQVNENAKALAFSSEFPEANHNEIESFNEDNDLSVLPLLLRSVFEEERLNKRFDITTKIYEDEGFTPIRLSMRSNSKIEEAMFMTYYLDRVSVELAALREVDPTSVDKISKLKQDLGES